MSDNERRETHADIIAEMRIFKCRNLQTGELEPCNAVANYFADRLEAAHRRELARLREALKKAEAVIDGVRMMVLQGQEYDLDLIDFNGALAKCREALAATETKGEKQ